MPEDDLFFLGPCQFCGQTKRVANVPNPHGVEEQTCANCWADRYVDYGTTPDSCHLLEQMGVWDTAKCCYPCHGMSDHLPLAHLVAGETVQFCCVADETFESLSNEERDHFIKVLLETRA